MGRPREHNETTAEDLLDAAEALLGAGGIDAVTVRATADHAEVSVRAVYSLFGSKEGLIDGLVARAFDRLAERVEFLPRSEDPAADLVTAGLEGFRAFATERPHLYRLTFEHKLGRIEGRPAWAESGFRSQSALRERVRALVPESNVENVTAQFHAICQGLASCEVNGVFQAMGVRDARAQWTDALAAYVQGLTTRA